ncbi:hypothetical protein [Desulfoplanes formicivorans]|uniref:Uncharacterized protein n=1 Tax=Desulfoplanes formicivorans TaxID=1592317 RepID=A0A194AJD9_9BACT|nr:hypothetical protein [Desulfoplanes formicivorans]GAU09355.1 hypothetical protein DPF_2078 [Desulfoplanes formicivorans]
MKMPVQRYRMSDLHAIDRKLRELKIHFEKVVTETGGIRFVQGERTVALWHRDDQALTIY